VRRWPDGTGGRGFWFARVACALLVTCLVGPVALGAPARHHKRRHTRAQKSEPALDMQAEPAPSSAPPPADTLPPDSAGPPGPTPPPPLEAEPVEAPIAPAKKAVPAAAEPEVPAVPPPRKRPRATEPSEVELALGRQEAARLAAGRIEVAVVAGLDVGRRDFTYSDPIGDLPQAYHLAVVPLATVGMDVHPFASTGVPVLEDLGMQGRFSRAFAVGSSTTEGAHLDTKWMRFGGDLRQRFLFSHAYFKEAGVAVGVDGDYFDLHTDRDVGALVPSARTVSLRIGADGRMFLAGRVSLLAGAGYLMTLSRGQIYERFPAPKVAGVDGDVAVDVRLTAGIDLRISGRYTRYFASFAPQVGDPLVAGGALDQQFQAGLGVRYAH